MLTPDSVSLFWTPSIADTSHHPPPGRRIVHPIYTWRNAFRHHNATPAIQPLSNAFDTGLSQPKRLLLTPFPQLSPAPIRSSGRSRP